jgi:hypothetical protein
MQDLSFADDVFPLDWPTGPGLPDGPERVKAWAREDHESFPDVRYEIEDVIVERDLAVLRWSASGTQLGAFGPIPPTKRSVSWSGIHIFRIREGRFVEYWVESDSLGRLRQLGVELQPTGPKRRSDVGGGVRQPSPSLGSR